MTLLATGTAPATLTPGQLLVRNRGISNAGHAALSDGWRKLGDHFTRLATQTTGMPGLRVVVGPGCGHGSPGCYFPARAVIELDGSLLGVADPTHADYTSRAVLDRLAVLHGVFCHEVGHSEHSHLPIGNATHHDMAVALIEEIRMEARVVTERAGDALWLRAAARSLLLDQLPDADDAFAAAWVSGLTEGRVAAGSLTPDDVAAVTPIVTAAIDAARHQHLIELWADVCTIADNDAVAMDAAARRLCDIVGVEPDTFFAGCGGSSDLAAAIVAAVGGLGVDALQQAATNGRGALLAAGVATLLDSTAEHDDEDDEEWSISIPVIDPAAGAPPDLATFAAKGRSVMSAADGTQAGLTRRAPTSDEQRTRRVLSARLRRAKFRARTKTTVMSELPPGRLNSREAITRSAQRANATMTTATPWTTTRHRTIPEPVLRVGIIVDTSGSMDRDIGGASSALWAVANAVADIGGIISAATFGNAFTPLWRPHANISRVAALRAAGGTSHTTQAIDAVAGALDLFRNDGPRLIVVISDGEYMDARTADARLAALRRSGVGVIQIGIGYKPDTHPADAIAVVTDGAASAGPIGDAFVAALRAH